MPAVLQCQEMGQRDNCVGNESAEPCSMAETLASEDPDARMDEHMEDNDMMDCSDIHEDNHAQGNDHDLDEHADDFNENNLDSVWEEELGEEEQSGDASPLTSHLDRVAKLLEAAEQRDAAAQRDGASCSGMEEAGDLDEVSQEEAAEMKELITDDCLDQENGVSFSTDTLTKDSTVVRRLGSTCGPPHDDAHTCVAHTSEDMAATERLAHAAVNGAAVSPEDGSQEHNIIADLLIGAGALGAKPFPGRGAAEPDSRVGDADSENADPPGFGPLDDFQEEAELRNVEVIEESDGEAHDHRSGASAICPGLESTAQTARHFPAEPLANCSSAEPALTDPADTSSHVTHAAMDACDPISVAELGDESEMRLHYLSLLERAAQQRSALDETLTEITTLEAKLGLAADTAVAVSGVEYGASEDPYPTHSTGGNALSDLHWESDGECPPGKRPRVEARIDPAAPLEQE